jgi:4-carboxymuconolactone decarboxylase
MNFLRVIRAAAPRMAPLEPPFDPATLNCLQKMSPPNTEKHLGIFRLIGIHRALAERMPVLGRYLLGRSALLSIRDREVVIDRVCARCGAEYEWGVHVTVFAQAAGFSPEEICAIAARGPSSTQLLPRDQLLVQFVDELHDTSDVSDSLWQVLTQHWSDAQLIELLVLAGWYRGISYLCNVARLPLEPWQAKFSEDKG